MKAKTGKQKLESTAEPIAPELLDDFVLDMIEALKGAGDFYAVADVDNLLLTPALEELLLFVGITSRQSGNRTLFAWTEAVKSTGGLNESKEI